MKSGWRGRRVVITAGPTREALDPVRFLSNESSGKMGWALARAARTAGARVTLIAGPTPLRDPAGIETIRVLSARGMWRALRKAWPAADAVIGAAAVADWRPERRSRAKIKKSETPLVLRLVKNPDLLGSLGKLKKRPWPRLAGFALENRAVLSNAGKKMKSKNLDLIVANTPRSLGGDRTLAWILRPGQTPEKFVGLKSSLARLILARLLP